MYIYFQELASDFIDSDKFVKAVASGKAVKLAAEDVKAAIGSIDIDVSKACTTKIPSLKPFPRLIGSIRPNWVEFKDSGEKYFSEYGAGKIEENPLGLEYCPNYFCQVKGLITPINS